MALATQCPHCYTSFRVANDQLKLHAGMVRCGACKQTFNGIEHLLAPGATAKTPPSAIQTPSDTPAVEEKSASEVITTKVVHENADGHVPLAPQSTNKAPPEIKHKDLELDASPEISSEFTPETKLSETKDTVNVPDIAPSAITANDNDDLIADESAEANIEAEQISAAPQLELSNSPIAIEADISSNTVDQTSNTPAANNEESKLISEEEAQALSNKDVDNPLPTEDIPVASAVADPQLDESDNSLSLNTALSSASATSATSATEPTQKQQAEPSLIPPSESEPEPQAETKPALKQNTKRQPSLTASLDFELSKEDREWVDELAHIHQLELETRAAVLDEATDGWSKHETASVQDGFIDSLKDLKPILANITAENTASDAPSSKTNSKHQTLNDLRVSRNREKESDSLTDQDDSFNDTVVHVPEDTPAFVLQAERAQRFGKWKRYGLGFGVILFTLLGLGQGAYFLRSDIAAQLPQLKPQLLSICKVLSCQIKLPAQKSLLEITGSELLIVNEELSMNTLSVQIQNKSGTVQAWPHFDLTLKDRRGKDLLQKAFSPTQYLDNKDLLNNGMAANSETNHKIFFQLNGLKASDYTVEIFYP